MSGILALPVNSAYYAAKGALEQASDALAAVVAELGIRVLIVDSGAFRTNFAGHTVGACAPISDYDATEPLPT